MSDHLESSSDDHLSDKETVAISTTGRSVSAGSVRKRRRISSDDHLSDDVVAISTTGRSVSAGSVKKRIRISSDDDSSDADHTADYVTPSPGARDDLETQRPRRKGSAQKTKRRLALEIFEKKRREGSVKKKLPREENVFSEISPNYDASPDSCQDEYIYVNDSLDEDELKFYSVSDNKSEEEDLEEGQSESSQSEEDMSDFIVSKDSENDSQENNNYSEKDYVNLLWKPSREEAFQVLVQSVLTSLLLEDADSVGNSDPNPRFEKAKGKIEKELESRKNLVTSFALSKDFMTFLKEYHVLRDTDLPDVYTAKCEACQRQRCIKRVLSLENEQGETVKEFHVGQFCADKGVVFHRTHHYLSVELKDSCHEKIPGLKKVAQMDSNRSLRDIVSNFCKEQKEWLNELYEGYEEIICEADEWVSEGTKYRSMSRVVSAYTK